MTKLDNIIEDIEFLEESTLLGIPKDDARYFEKAVYGVKKEEAK